MFAQTGVKVVPLTRKFAKEFSDLPTYKGDRDRETTAGRQRIAWLERLVDEGKFHSPKWATATLGKKTYRVNGGHSSYMLSQLNGNFPTGMKCIIDEFDCETDRDLAELFSQFDNRCSVRTTTDKIRAHMAVELGLEEVSPTDSNNAVRGIAFFLSSCGEGDRLDTDEVVGLIHDHTEFIVWARSYMRKRQLKFTGSAAAIFATYQVDQDVAREFWDYVMNENHASHMHASRRLAKFLVDQVAGIGNRVDARCMYAKSIHAWNAFRTGLGTDMKYFANAPLPKPK